MTTLTIRPATEADVETLVRLVNSAYRDVSTGWTTEDHLISGPRSDARAILEAVTGATGGMFIAEQDGHTVGCCQLEREVDHAAFGMFAVTPARQGAGLGRVILDEAERVARDEWGVPQLRLTVIMQRTDLIAWYVRRGYHRTGELIPFPYDDEHVGTPLRDDLAFELLVKSLGDSEPEHGLGDQEVDDQSR